MRCETWPLTQGCEINLDPRWWNVKRKKQKTVWGASRFVHLANIILLLLYNPLWVLAFSVILFPSVLSLHNFPHPFIPILCISSSTSSIHLFLDLPLILLPIGFHCNTLLGVLFSSICIMWPGQAILLLFINLTMSAFSISSLVRGSFWFSRIHLHFSLDQRFSLIFYAQIF